MIHDIITVNIMVKIIKYFNSLKKKKTYLKMFLEKCLILRIISFTFNIVSLK